MCILVTIGVGSIWNRLTHLESITVDQTEQGQKVGTGIGIVSELYCSKTQKGDRNLGQE